MKLVIYAVKWSDTHNHLVQNGWEFHSDEGSHLVVLTQEAHGAVSSCSLEANELTSEGPQASLI